MSRVDAPTVEPVTLAEARLQCRVDPDNTREDAFLEALIAAAREMAEHETGQRLITQTWADEASPTCGFIRLSQTPAQAVTAVTYLDAAGAQQTLAADGYRLDRSGSFAVLRLVGSQGWPSNVMPDSGFTVQYTAGFGDTPADVPASIRQWMLAHIDSMWVHRGAVGEQGANFAPLPFLARLLDPWRVYT